MYYRRIIEETIREVSEQFPCITIYGPRQVGKSTVVDHVFGDSIPTVSMDDSDELQLAITDPKMFLLDHGWPLIIDEVQKAKELLPAIKILIDDQKLKWLRSNEHYKLMFILTGSSQFELQEAVAESLAGRTAVINMSSFSLDEKRLVTGDCFNPEIEVLRKKESEELISPMSRPQVFAEIFEGGMPELVAKKPSREIFFKSYIDTYMERDVRKLIASGMELQFRNFLSYVALRTAQEINYDDISRSIGIDSKTCRRWISILATSGLIVLLPPYMQNASTSIIKTPKLYFMDTGLCAYLCGWPNSQMLEKGAMSGAFYETFVVSEIIKGFWKKGLDYRSTLFFFRTKNQKEIDLIYEKTGEIYPIEIKKGIEPSRPTKNFESLLIFKKPIKTGLVVCSADRVRPINKNAYYCPVSLISL